ncbi:MAG: hypothetical protein IT577_23690 [Verrucomicrobiae bacterium]|nr:hypothetical protein [Verrucomicrobiae bacterium]
MDRSAHRSFKGARSETDPTDAQVWLGRLDAAVAAGRSAQEAIGFADQASLAFRERFAAAALRSGKVTSAPAGAAQADDGKGGS